MNRRVLIPLMLLIGLFISFFVGVFAQQPGLALSYLCLAPWIGFWLGRSSVGVLKGARVALVRTDPMDRRTAR